MHLCALDLVPWAEHFADFSRVDEFPPPYMTPFPTGRRFGSLQVKKKNLILVGCKIHPR